MNVFSIISVAIASGALVATWWQGSVAWDTEKRSLRAYVSSDEPGLQPVSDAAGTWSIIPKWANHGNTPTRNAIVTLECLSVSAEGTITILTSPGAQKPREISPGHPISPGVCDLTAAWLAFNTSKGIRYGARSTVDYLDIFGEAHHSEQCFTVLWQAPTYAIPLPCERNCEDEECKTVPAPTPRRSLLDRLLHRDRAA
jgi:hypothetical protein